MQSHFNALIVDDERGIREGCRRVLARYANVIDTSETGEEAVAKFRPGFYDLALVDIKMPGMGGLALLEILRERDPYLMSIVITGYATLETAIEATRRGAYDFLPKPFTPDELMAKVWKALERRQLVLEALRLREERERRLLELATEKSRLRTIINCMRDGVLVTNREGQIVLYNPAARGLLGLPEANLIARPAAECIGSQELVTLLLEVLTAETNSTMLVRELPGADPDRTLIANVAPVLDEANEKIGAVAVLHDISQLKALDQAKTRFVSLVSHELRAPLAAIEGYLSLVLSGASSDNADEQRDMLTRCRARARSLLNLIDDLLDITHIESGKIAKEVAVHNAAEVVRDVVALLRPQASAQDVRVYDEMPASLMARADREDLVRIFTNLVSNAIKYNRRGGEVHLRGQEEGPWIRFDIVDTGIGIPPHAIDKVFDDFYRVKCKETIGIDGTGLGLPIAKRLVELYHGTIKASSQLGVGSTFTVLLPKVEDSA